MNVSVIFNRKEDKIRVFFYYFKIDKPEVTLHVENLPKLLNKIDLIENIDTFDIKLFCNTTANPNVNLIYEWYLNNNLLSGKHYYSFNFYALDYIQLFS